MTPTNLEETLDAIRSTSGPLECLGAGTKRHWGGRVENATVLSTSKLHGVISHDPHDLTARVLCGTPLQDIQSTLAEHSQWLPLDPAYADRATLGGLFSTNDYGPLRLGYGTLRDTVIGMTVVLSDGTVARSGGKVIKNVAGYDLCRLLCGALGTLGFVVDLTLRVSPKPERTRTVATRVDIDDAGELGLQLLASTLEPVAADWRDGRLAVRFAGNDVSVAAQTERWLEHVRASRPEAMEEDAEIALWDEIARDRSIGPKTTLRIMTLPADLRALAERVEAAAPGARLTSDVCLGLHTIELPEAEVDEQAARIRALQAISREIGGASFVVRGSRGVSFSPLGPGHDALPLMKRVRAQLDPNGRFAPGRLWS